jgi:hypothetical protein
MGETTLGVVLISFCRLSSKFLFFFAAAPIYSAWQATSHGHHVTLGQDVLAVVLSSFLASTGVTVRSLAVDREQRRRDRLAMDVLRAVRQDPAVIDYCLYCRPFAATRNLFLKNPARANAPIDPSYHAQPEMLDLETELEQSVREFGPLVALGRPGEHVGAGRIAIEDPDWQVAFIWLAQHARLIFVIPSFTEGTRWEIRWLKEHDRLSSCVFIIPGAGRFGTLAVKRDELDIEVPITPAGAGYLFKVSGDGKVSESIGLQTSTRRELSKAIRALEHGPKRRNLL